MKKTNSDILKEVKKTILPKSKKLENNLSAKRDEIVEYDNSDISKKIIGEWIDKNAEKITKEVVKDHLKRLFK